MWSHSHDGVDVAVGIIAYQIAVIQPDDSLELEESLQQMVDAVVVERLVAVRRQQALRGGEECTLSVTLDAASFEHEALVVLYIGIEGSLIV